MGKIYKWYEEEGYDMELQKGTLEGSNATITSDDTGQNLFSDETFALAWQHRSKRNFTSLIIRPVIGRLIIYSPCELSTKISSRFQPRGPR
jgi:hypothetical protein